MMCFFTSNPSNEMAIHSPARFHQEFAGGTTYAGAANRKELQRAAYCARK